MFKNLTTNQISIFVALCLGLLNTGLFVVLSQGYDHPIWHYLVLFILSVTIGLLVVRYFLERFVFRKIKLMYKIIRDSKLNPTADHLNHTLGSTNLMDVNNEVVEWAKTTQTKLRDLKTLESYRKSYVGNISHELKTPIFSIQGFLYTLLDGGLYDESINRKYIERAAINADRLQTIVEDLEVITKLESGSIELDIENFDLKALAAEVFQDLELMAKENGISIGFKEGDARSFNVSGDKENIRQVFVNLITNALKYGEEGGQVEIGFYDMVENVLVEVSDDGIGIEEQHLKHLFDRFYRVDASRSREQGGSGLGLSIVKHIIEAHHQTITVRSTVGVGSTFGFTLAQS